MKRIAFILIFFCLIVQPSIAEKVELFGYFESQLMGVKTGKSFVHLHSNKLRVDLAGDIHESASFGANFDYITYHGETTWKLLDYLPRGIKNTISPGMEPFYTLSYSDRSFLDNAYIKLAFEHADLTFGKQQISLGTGYAWNPVDVFNTKDLFDPTYEQPGHNAIRFDIPLGSRYTITALYGVGDEWNDSDKLLSFKGRISHFDYEIIGLEKIWTFHDYTTIDSTIQNFVPLPEKRQFIGFTMVGELLGLGLWAEYAHNEMENSKDFIELLIGADYTLNFQTYVMLEYYRNTLGKRDYGEYTLNDWMRYFSAEQKAISRDQIYAFLQHPISDLMDLGFSTIISISDRSTAAVPTLTYRIFQNVELFTYLNLYNGSEGKAYSHKLGNGALMRARVYF